MLIKYLQRKRKKGRGAGKKGRKEGGRKQKKEEGMPG